MKRTKSASVTSTTTQSLDKYLDRFFLKLEEDFETGCLLYTGGTATNGYGIFHTEHGSKLAHRFAFETYHGPCPSDKVVGHSSGCSGRTCCNPLHLSAITPKQNQQQRVVDGTMYVPRRKPVKATEVEIADIRARADRGESRYSIAKIWNRAVPYISAVVSRKIHPIDKPAKAKKIIRIPRSAPATAILQGAT